MGTMSTGQRQRIKLAQALAHDPKLVLLDEPTDGLDPVQRDSMLQLIVQIHRDFGIDVLLSSHLLEEVERICDHVVALDHGTLVAQGSIDELVGTAGGVELELVETDDLPDAIDAVAADLTARGASVRRSGAVLHAAGFDDEHLLDLATAAVASSGARLRRLAQSRRSLDELFHDAEELGA